MKTLKLPSGSLRQQLQEQLRKEMPCACDGTINDLVTLFFNFNYKWLEQKLDEVLNRKPTRIDDEDNRAVRQFIRELLEDLKK